MKRHVHLAYVGTLAPDADRSENPAFSHAGNQCQMNLLKSLHEAGVDISTIIARYPIPLFPKGRMIWVSGVPLTVGDVGSVHFAPFVNIVALREITISLSVIRALQVWSRSIPEGDKKVVLTYNLRCPPGMATVIGARLIGAKAIACVHDINVPGETAPNGLKHRLEFALQRQAMLLLDGLMVATRNIIDDFAPHSTWITFEPGIDGAIIERFDRNDRPGSACTEQFVMVTAGTLSEINGIKEIIGAMRYLDGERYHLKIAGRGPLENYVKEAAHNDNRIEYCGYLSHDDILALYETADVLINMRLTTEFNTQYFFPSKLVEFMATGVPVISTGVAEIANECDQMLFLINNENSEALARMIAYVASLDKKECGEVGRRAVEWIGNNLTWDILGRHAASFIDELVEE